MSMSVNNALQHWLDYLEKPHSPTPGKMGFAASPHAILRIISQPAQAATATDEDVWRNYHSFWQGGILYRHNTSNGKTH